MNNPIWVMTSAFPRYTLPQVMEYTKKIGASGNGTLRVPE